MDVSAVLLALVTLAAGLAVGWVLARGRNAAAAAADRTRSAEAVAVANTEAAMARTERDGAIAERDRLRAQYETALADLRTSRDQLMTAEARLIGQEELLEQQHTLAQAHEDTRRELSAAREQLAGARAELAKQSELIESQRALEEQVKEAFERLSGEALQKSQAQFLEIADDKFKQAGRPLTETLTKVEQQMLAIERSRAGAQEALKQQIEFVRMTGEQLKTETAALVGALRKPQARGRWGELQLKRCIDHAGMTERCDFFEQTSVATDDGLLRPDVLIRLAGGKSIVVDSKVTLAAYLEAHEASDDAVRAERLGAHARHLRKHVNDLAAKAYWAQFSPSPEFVVLFVPGDPFLAAALEADPDLIDDAFTKKVHIATPTTLISTLRTVAYAWQQQALADNARKVFDLGRELYDRLGTLGGKVDTLGTRLTGAVKAYNETVASLEGRVLVTARKLNALEVVDAELTEPKMVGGDVRLLSAAELIAGADEARVVKALPAAEAGADALPLDGRVDDYGIDAGGSDDKRDWRTGS